MCAMYLFILSQENLRLAEYEITSLLELKNNNYSIKKHLLISNIETVETKNLTNFNRLAFTKEIHNVLFCCEVNLLSDALLTYDFSKIYTSNFCLRIHVLDEDQFIQKKYSEKEYSSYIWKNLSTNGFKPQVNLSNSRTKIVIFISDNIAYVCKFILENNEVFRLRKAHLRQKIIPTAMNPKMARALINLLGPAKKIKKIIDPFCGAGGILTEAGLMGLRFKGYDIDQKLLDIAEHNFKEFHIPKSLYQLKKIDSTKIKNMKNIVTDLPYGKSSKTSSEMINLYICFVKHISGDAVVVMPSFIDFNSILEHLNKKLSVETIIDHYVHKSLTRKIIVIRNK